MNAIAKAQPVETMQLAPAPSESAAILSVIERMAMNPEIDPDRIERFIVLKERMEANVAKKAYAAAYAKMQPELPRVEKRGIGNNSKKYGLWEDIQDGVVPVLARHGFGLTFKVDQSPTNGDITITAIVLHEDGHEDSTPFVAKADKSGNKNDIQAISSTISYGKRIAACALLNIRVGGEDDDGKAAGVSAGISDEQRNELIDLMEQVGFTEADDARLMKVFKVQFLADLPSKDYARAVDLVKAKKP